MPGRKAQPPRLWLRSRGDGEPTWVILHRGRQIGTGCRADDVGGAARELAAFIASQHQPTLGAHHPASVETADVLTFYVRHKRPAGHETDPDRVPANTRRAYDDLIGYATTLTLFWGDRKLSAVKGQSCREYVAWRTAQPLRKAKSPAAMAKRVTASTARRELEVLRAAINLYHAEFTLDAVPKVTMPEKAQPRERWMTRSEAARLLAAALGFVWDRDRGSWKRERRDRVTRIRRRHTARFILIGIYTGTRHEAIERLQWHPNTTGGWFDLERGVMHRRGIGEAETKKRRPPTRIPHRLMPHLRRWAVMDGKADRHRADPTVFVIHKPDGGALSGKIRTSWEGTVADAGLGPDVVPHVMRHTAATWHMQNRTDLWEAAGALGMTPEQLQRGYGHHSPDFQEGAAGAFSGGNGRGTRQRYGNEMPRKAVNEAGSNSRKAGSS